MSNASIDGFLSSRDRQSWPGGLPYNFQLNNSLAVKNSTTYQITLWGAQIPNQYMNVFEGINDTLYYKFIPPGGMGFQTVDQPIYSIVFPEGNYEGIDFATILQTQIQAKATLAYVVPGPIPVFAVGYDPLQGSLQWSIDAGWGIYFYKLDTEPQSGFPLMTPSQRLAQMLGLHNHFFGYPGFLPLTSTGADINTELLHISGTKYVDLCTSLDTGNCHSNPYLTNKIFSRIPMGALGSITDYAGHGEDRGMFYAEGAQLQQIQFTLYDEWGLLFVIPSSHNIGLRLRLYPGQSSDYSG